MCETKGIDSGETVGEVGKLWNCEGGGTVNRNGVQDRKKNEKVLDKVCGVRKRKHQLMKKEIICRKM